MKITKTFLSVFFLTFLIGYVSVLPVKKISAQKEVSAAIQVNLPEPQVKTKPDLETIEEMDSWVEEDKYPYKIKLLETGEGFHGDEVKAKSGEIWLGLFQEGGKFHLRPTKLNIKRVHDSIVDEDERKKTGKSVNVDDKNKPVFLLKNADFLRKGEIPTFFKGVTWQEYVNDPEMSEMTGDEALTGLRKDFTQEYEFGGKKYKLKVIEAKNKDNERILALTLESGGLRQILHTMNIDYNSDLGTLYWVGDLDKDNKPDFYLSLFVHYNVGNQVLFLSSKAPKDKLVKKVAYFWTTGC